MRAVFPQQACTDGVKCSSPGECTGEFSRFSIRHVRCDPFHSPGHFICGSAGERKKHYPAWIDSTDDQASYSMGKRIRLARACSCDDQERSSILEIRAAILDGVPLFRIENAERVLHDSESLEGCAANHDATAHAMRSCRGA